MILWHILRKIKTVSVNLGPETYSCRPGIVSDDSSRGVVARNAGCGTCCQFHYLLTYLLIYLFTYLLTGVHVSTPIRTDHENNDAVEAWLRIFMTSKEQERFSRQTQDGLRSPTGAFLNKWFLKHIWSRCYLDLWPFELEISVIYLCPQLHLSCKFSDLLTSVLYSEIPCSQTFSIA